MKSFFKTSLLLATALTMVFASCKKEDDPKPTFIVTFDSQGGSTVAAQTVEEGSLITKPTDPTQVGFTCAGWYKETAYQNAWNFEQNVVTSNITLYAKWDIAYTFDRATYKGDYFHSGAKIFIFYLSRQGLFDNTGIWTGIDGNEFYISLCSVSAVDIVPKAGEYTFMSTAATTYAAGTFTANYWNYKEGLGEQQYAISSGTLTISASEIQLNLKCADGEHKVSYKGTMKWVDQSY